MWGAGIAAACVEHLFFFFNDTATTEIYTLSLHDALPIYEEISARVIDFLDRNDPKKTNKPFFVWRSEEHTSELQSRRDLVCRLLLEKKKQNTEPQEERAPPHANQPAGPPVQSAELYPTEH